MYKMIKTFVKENGHKTLKSVTLIFLFFVVVVVVVAVVAAAVVFLLVFYSFFTIVHEHRYKPNCVCSSNRSASKQTTFKS